MKPLMLLVSIIFGLLPEAIFCTLFLMKAKGIVTRRFAFFILMSLVFIGEGMLFAYNIWCYIVLAISIYGIMKLLYGDTVEFIDMFLISISFLVIAVVGYICFIAGKLLTGIVPEPVMIMLIVNRILLFILLSALSSKLNVWYNSYKRVWNRHVGNKIKSITVRNISIFIANVVIMAANTSLLLIR